MKKRFLMPDTYWETGLLEQFLEEKAAQGWMPVSFSGYSSGTFEKGTSQALRFRLEPARPETLADREERENVYREMGWQFAAELVDYRVYYAKDPAAPELYTDPATQGWAWDRQLRKLRRDSVLYILLLAFWSVWQFRSLWEKDTPVETFLSGMWTVWLFVVWYFLRGFTKKLRALRGIRRVRRQLEAGIALSHGGDVAASLRRQKRSEVCSWAAIALLMVFMVSLIIGNSSPVELSEAPPRQPWVAMATLDPDTAGMKMDWGQYRERRGLLVPFACQAEQWRWNFGPYWDACFERTALPVFAKALYEERLRRYTEAHPTGTVEILEDPRFDGAALVTSRNANDTGNIQAFMAYKDRAAVYGTITMDADLRDHLDDFAAILADFQ